MKIENLKICSGCHACYSTCPKSAITMDENLEGFLYPQIDKTKCVGCGLCEKVCPVIEPLKNHNENSKVNAAINNDEKTRLESSSGGIFTAIAEKVLDAGGVVFGAKFADDFSVIHSWTESREGLTDFRGSKYLQSIIGNSYKDCKNFLLAGRKVLFSGTPCQIQGLKKFLGKEYENLLCMDVICHGVPSNKVWQKYIDLILKKNGKTRSDVTKTSFRRKNEGWKKYSLAFTFKDASEYSENQLKGWWMLTFNKNIMMRSSCYDCCAKDKHIISDFTVGDFWGIEAYLSDYDDKGTSIIYVNSAKGLKYFSDIGDKLKATRIDDYNAERYNTQLIKSIKANKNRNAFFNVCLSNGFEHAYKKYVKPKLYIRIYKLVRRSFGKFLRTIGIRK